MKRRIWPMTVDTKELVTTIAYMIGVKKYLIEKNFEENVEQLDSLCENKEATIIRCLCKLRTQLMRNFKKTDQEMRYYLKNLNSLDWFDNEDINQLEAWGIPIIKANYRSDGYMQDITQLINERIDDCTRLFPEWVKWEYIRDLFYIPKYSKPNVMKDEFSKYMGNFESYPYQMYVHWNPVQQGNILSTDRKFLNIIYQQHGDYFADYTKYQDAAEETKSSIYSFVDDSYKTAIAVDCENSDPFKFYSVLRSLKKDELAKIEKITLYDDPNTTSAWQWIAKFTAVPVEYIEVNRVVDRKSLVDIRMTASVCRDFYENGITSFIIVSSDSDYWGLISAMPNAKFLVMYEYDKCGDAIKNALDRHGIYYCAIDDFCTAGIEEVKRAVLLDELEKRFPDVYGEIPLELTRSLYEETRITYTAKELENFCARYVKTLKLIVAKDGTFSFEIQNR